MAITTREKTVQFFDRGRSFVLCRLIVIGDREILLLFYHVSEIKRDISVFDFSVIYICVSDLEVL